MFVGVFVVLFVVGLCVGVGLWGVVFCWWVFFFGFVVGFDVVGGWGVVLDVGGFCCVLGVRWVVVLVCVVWWV
ncbi:hypothetical protein ABTF88_21550, partial [Acinetobacter baumannii]